MVSDVLCNSNMLIFINQSPYKKKLLPPLHAKAYNRMRKKLINYMNIKRLLIYYNIGPQVD